MSGQNFKPLLLLWWSQSTVLIFCCYWESISEGGGGLGTAALFSRLIQVVVLQQLTDED